MKRVSTNQEHISSPTICKFFARGYCARGSNCYYSHSYLPYGNIEFNSVFAQNFHVNEKLVPPFGMSKICEDYRQGHCTKGLLCPSKHILLSSQEVSDTSSLDIGIGARTVGRRFFGKGDRTLRLQRSDTNGYSRTFRFNREN